MGDLNKLLSLNDIKAEEIENLIYRGIILNLFEKIYNYLEKDNNRREFLKKLRSCKNKEVEIYIYNNLVEKITNLKIEKEEIKLLRRLIKAYLQKTNSRILLTLDQKNNILSKQSFKCNICKKNISLRNCHFDHIIPFKYVGDELDNNFQALCKNCNLSKNANIYSIFDEIIQIYSRD